MSQPQLLLLQYGRDPLNYQFEDMKGRIAFSVSKVVPIPNVVAKIGRHEGWSSQFMEIMGPSNAYLFFGPLNSPGQVAYGNAQRIPMSYYLRKKGNNSSSRYFSGQNGREYKWKTISPGRMELWDSRSALLAVWEMCDPVHDEHDAQITLTSAALSIVTEVFTTLTLNLVAKELAFW